MDIRTQEELREMLKQRVADAGTQQTLADEWQIKRSYLSDLVNGRRDINDKIAERLGYVRKYVRTA
jgi:plasmid maintenance system antidote protein VapI